MNCWAYVTFFLYCTSICMESYLLFINAWTILGGNFTKFGVLLKINVLQNLSTKLIFCKNFTNLYVYFNYILYTVQKTGINLQKQIFLVLNSLGLRVVYFLEFWSSHCWVSLKSFSFLQCLTRRSPFRAV